MDPFFAVEPVVTPVSLRILVVSFMGAETRRVINKIREVEPELAAPCVFTTVNSEEMELVPEHDAVIIVSGGSASVYNAVYDEDLSNLMDRLTGGYESYISHITRKPVIAVCSGQPHEIEIISEQYHVHGGAYTILQYGLRKEGLVISNTTKNSMFFPFRTSPLKYLVSRVTNSIPLKFGMNIYQ